MNPWVACSRICKISPNDLSPSKFTTVVEKTVFYNIHICRVELIAVLLIAKFWPSQKQYGVLFPCVYKPMHPSTI